VTEIKWKTSAPKGKNPKAYTKSGTYTATVNNVTADGHDWDGVKMAITFDIQ
jgi:hypothetical protein